MLSPRFAWPAAALLVVAAIPTLLHVYRSPAPLPPGALAAALPERLAEFDPPEPGRRRAAWVEETFDTRDFVTRAYPVRGHEPLELFAARHHDGKKLFHFPELALTYGRSATAVHEAELGAAGAPLPARVIEFRTQEDVRVAAYALLYGERAVAKPIPFYLSILPELFVGEREPMTLLYVQGAVEPGQEDALEEELLRLLAAAAAALRG